MEWFYEKDGQAIGPVDDEKIRELIKVGAVLRQAKVWNRGMSDWTPLETSELHSLIPSGPPPLRTPQQFPQQPIELSNRYPQMQKAFCRNCGSEVNLYAVACTTCGFQPKAGKNYCNNCGCQTNQAQVVCVACGASLSSVSAHAKSNVASGVLAIMLGAWGAHQFYLGNTGNAVLRLSISFAGLFIFTVPTLIMGVISFIEGIKYLSMNEQEFKQTYIINKKMWF